MMTKAAGTTKIERTSQGLRDALFDEMDALREGRSTPSRAGAFAKLSVQIIGSVQMEIDYQKHVRANGGTGVQMIAASPSASITLGKAA